MSKRNFILLIIILAIIVVAIFGFLFFSNKPATPTTTDNGGTNFFSQFNPFSSGTTPATCKDTNATNYGKALPCTYQSITNCEDPGAINYGALLPCTYTVAPEIKLKKVSSMPIAGFTVFSKERLKDVQLITTPTPDPSLTPPPAGDGKSTKTTKPVPPATEFMPALRYVERATGNVYQTFADKIEERKFSTTVIPKVYEALFGNKGESVAMRYLKANRKTIETFVGNLPKEILGGDTTDNNEIKGAFLPDDVKDMSLSPDNISLFYLFNNGESIIGTTLNFATSKKVQVFSSPFTEWLSSWPNSKTVTLTTKPASGIPGYMYALNLSSKNFNKIFGGIGGLTTLMGPDGKSVLFGNDSLSLSIYHTDTKTSDTLGIKTLPEKCVWNKIGDTAYCAVPIFAGSNSYPDSWYQGEVSFSDQIWKIDIKTGNTTMILDPINVVGGEEIDGIKLALDEGENYLFFVNKKDSFLWEFGLK